MCSVCGKGYKDPLKLNACCIDTKFFLREHTWEYCQAMEKKQKHRKQGNTKKKS